VNVVERRDARATPRATAVRFSSRANERARLDRASAQRDEGFFARAQH
jgi:hypothetical protein